MRNLQFLTLAITAFILSFSSISAQTPIRSCATHEAHLEHTKYFPEVLDNVEDIERHTQKYITTPQLSVRGSVITIPVVIHIVHRTANPSENISDEQIMSQLETLNNDYRRLNKDATSTPSLFQPLAADCGIEFKLAQRTPDGKATNGIERYASARKTPWGKSDDVKIPSLGGISPWNPSKYLNLYVCAIGGGVLGYSSMPGSLAAYDGVVIDYRFFGTKGSVVAPFNMGRTTTHEVGHWLNLRHTWGDNDCGDDLVNDTPKQREPNYGCVAFPHISCSNDSRGDMFMNFMDYTDDGCMNMFSVGQKARIQALFALGGARSSLLTSDALTPPMTGCVAATHITAQNIAEKSAIITWMASADIKETVVEYKAKNSADWLALPVKNAAIAQLDKLVANTEYEYRVKSLCPVKAELSTVAVFKTLPASGICNDIFELNTNNTFSTAKEIPLNATLTALIDSKTDNDYFVFKVADAHKHIQVSLNNLPNDYDVRLYNSQQQLIGSSNRKGLSDEKIVFNNAPMDYYYVRVFSTSTSSATQCYKFTVNIAENIFTREDGTDNLSDVKTLEKLQTYPNPASENINVELAMETEGTAHISLMDMTGRPVLQKTYDVSPSNNIVHLDIMNAANGFYILNVQLGEDSYSKKVMIAR
jgi:hypothetical protein